MSGLSQAIREECHLCSTWVSLHFHIFIYDANGQLSGTTVHYDCGRGKRNTSKVSQWR